MNTENQRSKSLLCTSSLPNHENESDLDIFEVSRIFQLQYGETLSIKRAGHEDYLCIVSGKITMTDHEGRVYQLDAKQSPANRAFLMPKNAHLLQIKAEKNSLFYHIDSEKLDYLVFWKELTRTLDEKASYLKRRMDKLRHFPALRRLPAESIYEAVHRMKIIRVEAGEIVVREGELGDAFYLIDSGRVEIWQTGFYDDKPTRVTELGEGDAFGEDALVTGGLRNATVRMIEKGQLLVLEQSDFIELISKPMVREVEADIAQSLIEKGYQILDVRCEEEHAVLHIPGAHLFPLHQLRQRIKELDPNVRYITYCRSGKRAAVAAFLLNQRKYEAVSLKGGLLNWPFELACWHLTSHKQPHPLPYFITHRLLKFFHFKDNGTNYKEFINMKS
jgi:rhodanese-related sulfurtransferase